MSLINELLAVDVRRRAFKIALIVGTLLVLINHGPALLFDFSTSISEPARLAQIVLTYFVPYGVSSYSSVAAKRNT